MATLPRRIIRSLRRSRAYAAASIGSVALGLGLSTATFAFIDSLYHVRPDSPDAARIFYENLRLGARANPPSVGERVRLLRTMHGVEDVAVATAPAFGVVATTVLQRSHTLSVSTNYWQMQAITPRLGRFPSVDDARTGGVAVVGDEMWKREFGNAPSINGATVRIGDRLYAVAAVLPPLVRQARGFAFVAIPFAGTAAIDTVRETANRGNSTILVKLRRGVNVAALAPELERVAAALTRDHVRPGERPYQLRLTPTTGPRWNLDAFTILIYLLGFGILAIGCANVAALTFARALGRRAEFALRLALGAGRRAIAAEVLGEVTAVTAAGSALGIGVTFALLGLLRHATPEDLLWEGYTPPVFEATTLVYCAFALLVAVAIGGAFPALRASRIAPNDALKDGAATTTGKTRNEFRALLITQLAIAMVLLMMASLEALSLRNVLTFDFGFPTRSVARASVRAGPRRATMTPAELASVQQRSLDVMRTLPGVRAVGVGGGVEPAPGAQIVSERSAAGEPTLTSTTYRTAGAGYFAAMGVRIIEGRDFAAGDATGRGAAVLSQTAARRLFPRGDAIGRLIKVGPATAPGTWVPVVGISADFHEQLSDDPKIEDPPVYINPPAPPSPSWEIVVRGDSAAKLVTPMRIRLLGAMPPQSTVTAQSYAVDMELLAAGMGWFAGIFGALGLAAVALGALGLYSVLSYVVGRRHREFAVRVALGATRGTLVRHVLKNGFEIALGGTAIGALLSFWASAGVSVLLFGVKNTDPVSLVIAEATLICVCMLASLGPAIRAARANPLDVLRAV